MSQDASARTKLLQPSEASPFSAESFGSDVAESNRFPVESYADRLMDDLFGDVERLLDSSTKPSTEQSLTESVRSEPTTPTGTTAALNSFVDLVSPLMRRAESESALAEQEYDALLAGDLVDRSITRKPVLEGIRESVRSYDRLLLGVGSLALLTVLAVWLLSLYTQRQTAPVAVAPQATTNPTGTSPTDNQFVSYLQQALKAIDQKQPQPSVSTAIGANGAPTNLPSISLPGNPTIQNPSAGAAMPNNAARQSTGLSRLYVPVYQVPPTATSGSPSVAPLPSAKAPTAVRPPIPLSVPGVAKTLVGVLELGDRSAALIEINGVAQRYRIGESIATSGWTLVEVANNQVVIRRNGEVRSVFIGQNF